MKYILAFLIAFSFSFSYEIRLIDFQGKIKIKSENRNVKIKRDMVLEKSYVVSVGRDSWILISGPDGKSKRKTEGVIDVGTLYTVNASKGLSSLLKKIIKKKSGLYKQIDTVAAIRGAEQGKKGKFGVSWKNTKKPRENKNDIYSQGVKYFENGSFNGAIKSFEKYIELATFPNNKAYEYIGLSMMEVSNYKSAVSTFYKGMMESSRAEDKDRYIYNMGLAEFLQGKNTESATFMYELINKKYSVMHWQAKALQLLNELSQGKKTEALALIDDILINCNDSDIVDSVSNIDI
jgi:tetratricopeptide (TPR) repeat protein